MVEIDFRTVWIDFEILDIYFKTIWFFEINSGPSKVISKNPPVNHLFFGIMICVIYFKTTLFSHRDFPTGISFIFRDFPIFQGSFIGCTFKNPIS